MDGSIIAAISWDDSDTQVTFINAESTEALFNPPVLILTSNPGNLYRPTIFWLTTEDSEPALAILDTENSTKYTMVFSNGTFIATPNNLTCIPYPSSSAPIRYTDGAFVDVNFTSNEIVISYLDSWNNCTIF